ncbi:Autophagy protein 22, partial [Elasticomyces elasticus]
LVLFVIGLWWLIFSIPAALWLRPRPGPPLPAHLKGWYGYVYYAWAALFKTLRQARKLKDIMIFLAAWFLLSDSIATVSGTAVLFAKTNLGMKVEALALISVIGTCTGIIGAFYWSSFSHLFGLRASQTIIACVCLFEVIPLYGMLGFIPAVQRLGYLGLQQPIEMYFLGAIYGFVLGGLSSYCRALFGELIPPGFEASFYALYAITDKGSSIFGPAIVGAITDRYGDIRPAFLFLAVLIFLPLPLFMLVNVDRGKADAAAMAVALEGKIAQTRPLSSHGHHDPEHG